MEVLRRPSLTDNVLNQACILAAALLNSLSFGKPLAANVFDTKLLGPLAKLKAALDNVYLLFGITLPRSRFATVRPFSKVNETFLLKNV